ncbi:MAG: PD-(D/E)XK nuclease family protein [Terriglobales bacterium]
MSLDRVLVAAADGATIITANVRTERRLHELYDQRARAAHRAWATPRILTWAEWIETLWQEYLLLPDMHPPLRLNPHQAQSLWERAVAASGKRLIAPSAAARLAAEAWKLLHEYCVDRRELLTATAEGSAFKTWADCFAATCADRNWIDAARVPDLLLSAVERAQLAIAGRFVFVGFDKFVPQQERMIVALRRRGCNCEITDLAESAELNAVYRVAFSDSASEIESAARWARARLEAGPAASIGIVVPSLSALRDRIARIFAEVLAPASLLSGTGAERVFELSLGCPLSAYPIAHAALDLLRWFAAPLPSGDAGALVRSVFLRGGLSEASRRTLLDAEMRRRCGTEVALDEVRRLARARDKDGNPRPHQSPELAQVLRRLQAQFDPSPKPPSAWSRHFIALLEIAGWPGDRPLDSADYQAWQAVYKLLRTFATLDATLPVLSAAEAVAQLAACAGAEIFQPENIGAPVQVLGHLEASGSRFDHLWVMGLDDETWPPRANPHPLVPPQLLKAYAMPHSSLAEDLQFAREITERLRRSAREVVFSYPCMDGDRPLRPSPLLAEIPECTPKSVVPPTATWVAAIHACADQLESAPDEAPEGLDNTRTRSANVFKLQARCPFSAFAQLRLGAVPLETPTAGLDPRERGKLVHRALQQIWLELKSSANLKALSGDAERDLLTRCVERAIADHRIAAGGVWSQRFAAIEANRLVDLLSVWLQLEKQRAGFEVVALEDNRQAEIGGLKLKVRIDRVDRLCDDGRQVILDYKTGRPAGNFEELWDAERPEDPQLPLYAVITPEELAALAFAHLRVDATRFHGQADTAEILPRVKGLGDGALAEKRTLWEKTLTELATAFFEGDARMDPKDGDVCEHCPLPPLCRNLPAHDGNDDDAEAAHD